MYLVSFPESINVGKYNVDNLQYRLTAHDESWQI